MIDLQEGILREFADLHGVDPGARYDSSDFDRIYRRTDTNDPKYNARKREWWQRNKARLNAQRVAEYAAR